MFWSYMYTYVTNTELRPHQKNLITSLEIAMPLAVVYAPNMNSTSKQPTIITASQVMTKRNS